MSFLKWLQLFNCATAINTITSKAFQGCEAEETLNQMVLVKYTNLMLQKQSFDRIEIPAHHSQILLNSVLSSEHLRTKVVPDLRLTHGETPGVKLQW